MPTDEGPSRPGEDRSVVRKAWEQLDPEEPAEAPPRTGLAGFLERLGKLFQMHPRGPFGS